MKKVITSYEEHVEEIKAVRIPVFVHEQEVPEENEMDERDPHCIHALIMTDHNKPIGTGRLDVVKNGKVGRVAVLKEHRGQGLGNEIMSLLEKAAKDAGLSSLWMHAQTSALEFYEKLGYRKEGEEFMEENIPHFVMRKELI